MGFLQNVFGKKAGDKAQDTTKTNTEISTEQVKESVIQTKEDLGGLAEQAEHSNALAKAAAQNNVKIETNENLYNEAYKLNLANHLTNKYNKEDPKKMYVAIDRVYSRVA